MTVPALKLGHEARHDRRQENIHCAAVAFGMVTNALNLFLGEIQLDPSTHGRMGLEVGNARLEFEEGKLLFHG